MKLGFIVGFTEEATSKDVDRQILSSKNILDSLVKRTNMLDGGLVTYGKEVILQQELASSRVLREALLALNIQSGYRLLSDAIKIASKQFFVQTDSTKVTKTLVAFVTSSKNPNALQELATVQNEGVNIIAIGIGENADVELIKDVKNIGGKGIFIEGDYDKDFTSYVVDGSFTGLLLLKVLELLKNS